MLHALHLQHSGHGHARTTPHAHRHTATHTQHIEENKLQLQQNMGHGTVPCPIAVGHGTVSPSLDKRAWVKMVELVAFLGEIERFSVWEEEQILDLCAAGDLRLVRLFCEHGDEDRSLFVQGCKDILPRSHIVGQNSIPVQLAGLLPRAPRTPSLRSCVLSCSPHPGSVREWLDATALKPEASRSLLTMLPEEISSKTISVDKRTRPPSRAPTPHESPFTIFGTLLTMNDSGDVAEMGSTSMEEGGQAQQDNTVLSFLKPLFQQIRRKQKRHS